MIPRALLLGMLQTLTCTLGLCPLSRACLLGARLLGAHHSVPCPFVLAEALSTELSGSSLHARLASWAVSQCGDRGAAPGCGSQSILVYSVHKKLSPTGDIRRANPMIKTLRFPGQGSIWQLMFVGRNPGEGRV